MLIGCTGTACGNINALILQCMQKYFTSDTRKRCADNMRCSLFIKRAVDDNTTQLLQPIFKIAFQFNIAIKVSL